MNQAQKHRAQCGLSVFHCAYLAMITPRTWQRWEDGTKLMEPHRIELFNYRLADYRVGKIELPHRRPRGRPRGGKL